MSPAVVAMSMDAVADIAYGAGFRGAALETALAVAAAESGLNANAEGDVALAGQKAPNGKTWGHSYGLWQIRTLIEEFGSGSPRDRKALVDAGHQARSAYAISAGGSNWRPWSVYTSGAYRKHLEAARAAAGARAGRGGSGSTATHAGGIPSTTTTSGERSSDAVVPVTGLPTAYLPPRLSGAVTIQSGGVWRDFRGVMLGGSVDLSLEETSEIQVRLYNRDLVTFGRNTGHANLGGDARWYDLNLRVAALELRPVGGGSEVLLTLRDRAVQRLKRTNTDVAGLPYESSRPPGGAHKNLSPTEYAAIQARSVGLRLLGEGSARRTDIAPQKDTTGLFESPWSVLQRLAGELGYVCFVAGDVLHFGRPTWLVRRVTSVAVNAFRPELGAPQPLLGWGEYDARHTLETPGFRESEDAPYFGRTLQFRLPRWRGELVRPGMRVELVGIPELNWVPGLPPDRQPGGWLVSRVGWPLDNGQGPVEVQCIQPVDPVAEVGTGGAPPDGGAGGSTSPTPTAATGAAGGGTWRWPTYGRVSSEYGPRDGRLHAGIDIAAPTGRPVRAARTGRVITAQHNNPTAGHFVVLVHDGGYRTRYLHLSRITVSVGQTIEAGAILGEVGSTGRSTGPHLHYEVLKSNGASPVNPRTVHTGNPTP